MALFIVGCGSGIEPGDSVENDLKKANIDPTPKSKDAGMEKVSDKPSTGAPEGAPSGK